jgi:hypothetical protein
MVNMVYVEMRNLFIIVVATIFISSSCYTPMSMFTHVEALILELAIFLMMIAKLALILT